MIHTFILVFCCGVVHALLKSSFWLIYLRIYFEVKPKFENTFMSVLWQQMAVKYKFTICEPLTKEICALLTVVTSILSIPPSGVAGAPRLGCYSLSSAAALWLLKKPGPSWPPGTPAGWWDRPRSPTSPCSETWHQGRWAWISVSLFKLLMAGKKWLLQLWPVSRKWMEEFHLSPLAS